MIVYIAGKMSGLPDCGWVAFSQAESKLTGLGYTVISPAWLRNGLPKKAYLPICMAMIDQADALAMLPGWEDSPGAKIEKAYAEYNEKPVYMLEKLLERGAE